MDYQLPKEFNEETNIFSSTIMLGQWDDHVEMILDPVMTNRHKSSWPWIR